MGYGNYSYVCRVRMFDIGIINWVSFAVESFVDFSRSARRIYLIYVWFTRIVVVEEVCEGEGG